MQPTWWRWVLAVMMATCLTMAGCGGSSGPDETEEVTASFGKNGPSARFTWNAGTGDITIVVTPPAKLKAGWCVDGIFDWKFDNPSLTSRSNHHDPRLVRVCRASEIVSHLFKDSSEGLLGINKAAVCYGPKDATNADPRQCRLADGSAAGSATGIVTVKTKLPNPCVGFYAVLANGTAQESDRNNDPTSCTD